MTTDGLYTVLQIFAPPYSIFGRWLPPISTAFFSPSMFRKSHESALLMSYGDESGLGIFYPLPTLARRALILNFGFNFSLVSVNAAVIFLPTQLPMLQSFFTKENIFSVKRQTI